MVRNLLYNCCPVAASKEWRLNVAKLNQYAGTFNGRRLVILRVGPGMAPPEEVQAAFTFEAEFIELPNNPAEGERSGLLDVLGKLESLRADEITFYAHTKGVSYTPARFPFMQPSLDYELYPIRAWRNIMYEQCLQDPQRIDDVMADHATCGCFRRKFSLTQWAFYGTFYWLRHDRLFSQDWRGKLPSRHHGTTETYPDALFPIEESYCLYEHDHDTNFSLYTMPHPFKCSKCHATQLCRIGLGHAPVVACPCGYVATIEIHHVSV